MKKLIIIVFLTFCSFLCFIVKVNASTNDVLMINDNGIEITSENYKKLISIGLVDREIDVLTSSEYEEYVKMEIVSVNIENYYIESIYSVRNGEVVDKETNYLSKLEIKNAIEADKIIEEEVELNQKPSGSRSVKSRSGYESELTERITEYKHMTVTGTFYKNEHATGQFHIKVNFEWLKMPTNRYTDIIGISFSDNVQIVSEYINNNQYPKFKSRFMYHEYYSKLEGVTYTEEEKDFYYEKKGYNTNDYTYNIDQGIGVSYDIPRDVHSDLGSDYYPLVYDWKYSNMFLSLEASFFPKQAGINASTFAGFYEHQTGRGSIDWGQISFSPTAPYFSYSTGFWVDDPTFEDLSAVILFDDLLFISDEPDFSLNCRTDQFAVTDEIKSEEYIYYKINVECPGRYKINTSSISGTSIEIFDENMNNFTFNSLDSGLNVSASVVFEKGIYYIKVINDDRYMEGISDEITTTFHSQISQIQGISANTTVDALEHLHDGKNHFSFTTSSEGLYSFRLVAKKNGEDIYPAGAITIRDIKGNVVQKYEFDNYDNSSLNSNNIIIHAKQWTSYYVDITYSDANVTSLKLYTYQLDYITLNSDDGYLNISNLIIGDDIKKIEIVSTGKYTIKAVYSGNQSKDMLYVVLKKNSDNTFTELGGGLINNSNYIFYEFFDLTSQDEIYIG